VVVGVGEGEGMGRESRGLLVRCWRVDKRGSRWQMGMGCGGLASFELLGT